MPSHEHRTAAVAKHTAREPLLVYLVSGVATGRRSINHDRQVTEGHRKNELLQ